MQTLKLAYKNSNIIYALAALPIWSDIYFNLEHISSSLTALLPGISSGHLKDAVTFFIFEVPKVLLLLILIVFGVGIVRSYFSPEKTRKALEGKPLFAGNVMASALGIVTPFCTCSAIPLFIGFVEAGIPLGVTFSFLIAAPMINEIALALLLSLFGWKTALIYLSTGLLIAMVSGFIIGKLKLEKWVQSWVYEIKAGKLDLGEENAGFDFRVSAGFAAVKEIVGKVWIYIVLGIAIGAGIHGYVPADFMASFMGKNNWYSIPLSVLIGVPMYGNAAGIIPIVQVLLEKGASLGSSLAFMMAVIGLSLPEAIILKKILKTPLLLTFFGIVAAGILIVGYLFNFFM